jgi:aquaporin Z
VENNARILAGETIASAIFVLGGLGAAVLGTGIGTLGIALAFGLAVMVGAVVSGHASGAHVNPAVSVAMVMARKTPSAALPFYLLGQLVGSTIGALGVWGIASGVDGWSAKNNFFANGWDKLSVRPVVSVVSVGMVVALVHLVTLPIDNTGLNPFRSFATALFSRGDALTQLWVFLLAPLLGAVIGTLVWLAVDDEKLEGTMLFNAPLAQARDIADGAVDNVVEAVEDLEQR